MLTEEQVETHFKTLAQFDFYMVMNTLGDTLAKTEVKTLRDRKTKRIENL